MRTEFTVALSLHFNMEPLSAALVIRLAKMILVSTLMLSIGAHWLVLQSAAWVSMAVAYSVKTGSVAEGISETFDGEHPCPLCCALKKAKESEKKDTQQESAKKKLDLFATVRALIVITAPAATFLPRSENQTAIARAFAPLHQPPRAA